MKRWIQIRCEYQSDSDTNIIVYMTRASILRADRLVGVNLNLIEEESVYMYQVKVALCDKWSRSKLVTGYNNNNNNNNNKNKIYMALYIW